jgi:hypothetical protein
MKCDEKRSEGCNVSDCQCRDEGNKYDLTSIKIRLGHKDIKG